jgi:flagellar biosynthesis/type III secretory pathway protein FliH
MAEQDARGALSLARSEGKAEGKAEGRAEGKAEGRAEGKAEAVLFVLRTRGIAVSEGERAKILACSDADVLEGWLRAAITASTTAELLG